MSFPLTKITFPSLAGFEADDVRLLNFIPEFFTVQNQDGADAWRANAADILEKMYFEGKDDEATFEFVPTGELAGFLIVTPNDATPQYEMIYSIQKGLSEVGNPTE